MYVLGRRGCQDDGGTAEGNSEGGCPHARPVSNAATAELFTSGGLRTPSLLAFVGLHVTWWQEKERAPFRSAWARVTR